MKKILALFAVMLTMGMVGASAQKVGHIDMAKIQDTLPSFAKAQKTVEAYIMDRQKQMQNIEMEAMVKSRELDSLMKTPNVSQLMVQRKQQDLVSLQQRYQNIQASAEQDLPAVQAEALKPIDERIRKAVSDVASKEALDYVIDIQVTYVAKGKDVTNQVITILLAQPEEK